MERVMTVGMSSRLRQAYVAAKFQDFETPYNQGAPKRSDGGLLIRRLSGKSITNRTPDERELIPTEV